MWALMDETACRKFFLVTHESRLTLIMTTCSCLTLPCVTVRNVRLDRGPAEDLEF